MKFTYDNLEHLSSFEEILHDFKDHVQDYIYQTTNKKLVNKKELLTYLKDKYKIDLEKLKYRRLVRLWYKYNTDELFRITHYLPTHFKIDKYVEKYPEVANDPHGLEMLNQLSKNIHKYNSQQPILIDKDWNDIEVLNNNELLKYTLASLNEPSNYQIKSMYHKTYLEFFKWSHQNKNIKHYDEWFDYELIEYLNQHEHKIKR